MNYYNVVIELDKIKYRTIRNVLIETQRQLRV